MKKIFCIVILTFSTNVFSQNDRGFKKVTFEYKVVTSVESIVPGGLGRSRIVENYDNFSNNDEMKSKSTNKIKNSRSSLKTDNFSEVKLLNFYSLAGINFQNIASNDGILSNMISTLAIEGWELFSVVSGVESDSGKEDGNGIFITRYIFKRELF